VNRPWPTSNASSRLDLLPDLRLVLRQREPAPGQKDLARGEDPLDLRTSILLLLQVEEYERETAQDTSPGIPT
jgi:hypothetical protein